MRINKLLSIFTVSAIALSGLSAFETKAKVTMEGSLARETKAKGGDAKYEVFNLDTTGDKGKNKVEIEVDSVLAGAHFELCYDYINEANTSNGVTHKAEDGWSAFARNTYIWFKPVDQVKLRLGYVGQDDFFVERIDEEKVGNPFSYTFRTNGNLMPYYITNADVDEMGFSLAVEPVENLMISAAIAPGVTNSGITKDGDSDLTYSAWGAAARYTMEPLKFEASFRDSGKKSWKVARLGAGYESETLYAFIQPVFGFDYITSTDKYEMNGFCVDLYGEYSIDQLKLTAHLPVTIRTTGRDDDPKYLEFLAKAEYNTGAHGLLDDVTPYILAKNMDKTVVTLDSNASDNLALTAQAGSAFKIANAELDVGVAVDVHAKNDASERITWAIPFGAKIEF